MKIKTCISCKEDFPATHQYFFYRNKSRGWLSSWCKSCRAIKRQETKDRDNEVQRIRRTNNPVRRTLKVSACVICGTQDKTGQAKTCSSCAPIRRKSLKRIDKAIYKSRLRKAMPKWANRFFIKEAYSLSRLRTKLTGVEWHVDHVIPIRGGSVCGLHTHENLQVILGVDNQAKGNHYSFSHDGRR